MSCSLSSVHVYANFRDDVPLKSKSRSRAKVAKKSSQSHVQEEQFQQEQEEEQDDDWTEECRISKIDLQR